MNRWSCSVQAAAKVMCLTTQQLIDEIGHDGGAIVFPELPEPMCRAGFHIQEIQDAAVRRGYAIMTVEAHPVATPNGVNLRDVFAEAKLRERMFWYMFYFNGIVVGQQHAHPTWHYNIWMATHTTKGPDDPGGEWFDAGGRPLVKPTIDIAYFYAFMKIDLLSANSIFP